MSGQYSVAELRNFLDWAANKGVLNRATALSWRTAIDKVLAESDETDLADLRNSDVEEVLRRFNNLHGKEYTPSSLRTYQGRVRSAVKEFLRYTADPANYSPRIARRKGRPNGGKNGASPVDEGRSSGTSSQSQSIVTDTQELNVLTIPIPIREGMIVRVQGLPADLTSTEADKVANVVKAYAMLDK